MFIVYCIVSSTKRGNSEAEHQINFAIKLTLNCERWVWCQREEIEVLSGRRNTKSRCVCGFKLDESRRAGRGSFFWFSILAFGWLVLCHLQWPEEGAAVFSLLLGGYLHFNLLFPLVAAQGVRGPAPAVSCLGPRRLAGRLLPHIRWLVELQCKFAFSWSILTTSSEEGRPVRFSLAMASSN